MKRLQGEDEGYEAMTWEAAVGWIRVANVVIPIGCVVVIGVSSLVNVWSMRRIVEAERRMRR